MSEKRRLLALAVGEAAPLDSAQRSVLEAAMNDARAITHENGTPEGTDAAIVDTFRDALRAGLATARPIVIIESPLAGDLERNARYLDACLLDSLRRGEAPFASHGLYTRPGVLRDSEPVERELGIQAGFAFRRVAARTVVYTDLGISGGMQRGIDDANENDCQIEYRKLGGEWGSKSCADEKESHKVNGFCQHCCDGWL